MHLSTGWSCNDWACVHCGTSAVNAVIGDLADLDSVNFGSIIGGSTDKEFISKTIKAV